ncbi:aldo/keto reductase [Paenibacillus sp.]|uniref:aldo/keto reductase n=1 Tax=Paenibacillus sp. TaxID=58172 RepID=UPI002D5BD37F|nr:aldo/keto reductase [Paenibacillus sp.]HZG55534.1 aldo/keto reductase [Paenibacillus sp.]
MALRNITIPGTELEASSISLGGVPFGSMLDEAASFRLMDAYAELGGNLIDTAEVYANWLPGEPSASERTIGKWMKSRGCRSRMIVTTKGAHPRLSAMQAGRLSPADIAGDVEDSLRRLQVDTIDLYWLHRDDASRSVADIVEALAEQARKGNIRYYGCSNWTLERLQAAQAYAAVRGLPGFCANQPMWSLAAADPSKLEDPTLVVMDEATRAYHRTAGLAAIPYSSQAQGLFEKLASGALSLDGDGVKPLYRSETNRERLARVRRLAAERSLAPTQVALGYLLSQPFPTIPIVGCRTPEQLYACAAADGVAFSEAELSYLEHGA